MSKNNEKLNSTGWRLVLTILITILSMIKNGISDSDEPAIAEAEEAK